MAQVAFMTIRDNEIFSNYPFHDENEDIEAFVMKLHEILKESYIKNKELKIKKNVLLKESSKNFQENKRLRKENDYFKKIKVDFAGKNDGLKKLNEKIKFYEKIKNFVEKKNGWS